MKIAIVKNSEIDSIQEGVAEVKGRVYQLTQVLLENNSFDLVQPFKIPETDISLYRLEEATKPDFDPKTMRLIKGGLVVRDSYVEIPWVLEQKDVSEVFAQGLTEFHSLAQRKKADSESPDVEGQRLPKEFLKETLDEAKEFFEENPTETDFRVTLPNGKVKKFTQTQIRNFYRKMVKTKQELLADYERFSDMIEAVEPTSEGITELFSIIHQAKVKWNVE